MFLVLILFMLFPDKTAAGAKDVLTVWYTAVVPSLLPFFIVSKLLTVTGEANRLARAAAPIFRFLRLPEALAYPFLMSLLCGSPTGSRILGDCRIPEEAKDGFAAVCCGPGPLFVIGTVGIGMLGSPRDGYILWLTILCAELLMLFFYPLYDVQASYENTDISAAEAVWDSLRAILTVAGFMLLFSLPPTVLFSLLPGLPSNVTGLLMSFCEFTGGIRILSALDGTMPLIAFFLTFGGGSVVFQCLSFLQGVSVKKFIFSRSIAGFLAFLLCFLAEKTVWTVPAGITLLLITAKTVHRRKKIKVSVEDHLLKSSISETT